MTLSPLSLGTWTFAGDAIWSASSEAESIAVIRHGAEKGIRLFDTAPNYGAGRSEAILGKALGNRDDVIVSSKCKIDGLDSVRLRRLVESSLKSLRRDAIDLMQIHWPTSDPEETSRALEFFAQLKKEGKIVEVGVCNFGKYDLLENVNAGIVSNQLPYSMMWRVIEEEIAHFSKESGLQIIAYSPLQQGLLTGKYRSLHDFPSGRKRTRHFFGDGVTARHGESGMEAETQYCLDGFLEISRQSAIAPPDLAISYILAKSFVDSVLAGARTVNQLDQLLNAVDRTLPDDLVEALDKYSEPLFKACGGNPDMYSHDPRVRYSKNIRQS